MGEAEINAVLSHLASKERVSSSTQIQALAALLFLDRTVLGGDVGKLEAAGWGEVKLPHAIEEIPKAAHATPICLPHTMIYTMS